MDESMPCEGELGPAGRGDAELRAMGADDPVTGWSAANDPLSGWSAGTSCNDFAGFGDQTGEAGERMEDFILWINDLLTCLPDWFIHEITDSSPPDFVSSKCQSKYGTFTHI